MRRTKTLFNLFFTLCLFQGLVLANDAMHGLFLVDQSQEMNQPAYAPRFDRALETLVREVQEFTEEAQTLGKTPYLKIVTFNDAMGYGERTPWTGDLDHVWDVLASLYDEQGFGDLALNQALCEAGRDLSLVAESGDLLRSYLFTNTSSKVNPVCETTTFEDMEKLEAKENHVLATLAQSAQWRVFHFKGLPKEQRGATTSIEEDLVKRKIAEDMLAFPESNDASLERLASLSDGVIYHMNDSRDFSETKLPCNLFDGNCEKGKSGTSEFWQYFSIGQYTNNLKAYGSTNATSWSGGDLNIAAKSDHKISAVRYQNRTYVFYRGETVQNIHYAWTDNNGGTWHGGGYVQTGAPTPVTITSPDGPDAIVANGKIRLFYKQGGFVHGPIYYLDSVSVNSNGSLNWSPTNHYTQQDSYSYESEITAFVDPTTNEENLIFFSRATQKLEMYGRSLTTPSQWQLKKTFNTGQTTDLEAVHTGSDLYIAYKAVYPNSGLYFMKKSNNYLPHHIHNSQIYTKPGLAHLNGKTVLMFRAGNGSIKYTSSLNGGVTWSPLAQAPEHTYRGIELISFTYTQPLTASITGPFFGDSGSPQTFTGSASSGTGPYTYQWTVDGVSAGNGSQLNWTFFEAGIYVINLTVVDANGNSASVARIYTAHEANDDCLLIICP